MDLNPVFSVIIPCYNRANTIFRAIDSVLKQTFDDFEIIVVNDGSTDDTASIVRGMHDPRIKFISYGINKGQIHATNTGVLNARGKYVSFLDSDDAWLPGMLCSQYLAYSADPEIGCVYANSDTILQDGRRIELFRGRFEGHIYREVLAQGYLVAMSTIGAKKSCLDEIFPLDGIFSGGGRDDEISFQLAKRFKFKLIPEISALSYNDGHHRIIHQDGANKCFLHLYMKHRDDIIENCGRKTLSRHFYQAAKRIMRNKKITDSSLAADACALSLSYCFGLKNILRFLLAKLCVHSPYIRKMVNLFFRSF